MTAFVLTANNIVNDTTFISVAVGDSFTVLQGVTGMNTVGGAVSLNHDNNSVLNMGSLLAGNTSGVAVNTVDDCDIVNTATGIIATLDGNYGSSAVWLAGDRNSLTTAGSIYSFNGNALAASGDAFVVENSGLMQGGQSGITAVGTNYSISNSGKIESGTASNSYGVRMDGDGTTSYLSNSGVIQALSPNSGTAIRVLGSNLTTIDNAGTILSSRGVAIDAGAATGQLLLTNTGQIKGGIFMGASDDVYEGSLGTAGFISGGAGNDAIAGGNGRENIRGDSGNDDLDGGTGNDAFIATDNDGDDIYDGGAGFDRISFAGVTTGGVAVQIAGQSAGGIGTGNIGNDTILNIEQIIGTSFTDGLNGDVSANQLYGGGGDDGITGLDGNDRLFGDAGADNIIGGQGRDYLTGGAGADTFRYQLVSESTTDLANRDLILDFVSDADVVINPTLVADVINLAAIDADGNAVNGNQAFVFIGYANSPATPPAFTGVAGQLRAYTNAGGATLVEADTNGDLSPDLQIQIFGVHAMAASDFVL
jgi:Ca2+-binding RTX toxin-like protein